MDYTNIYFGMEVERVTRLMKPPRPKRPVSRREFIYWSMAGLLAVANLLAGEGHKDPTLKIEFDGDDESLSFPELAALAVRLDRAFDSLPKYEIEPTPKNLRAVAQELYVRFEHEGFGWIEALPEKLEFVFFEDNYDANNSLGESDCESYVVLNGRMTLVFSPRYGEGWIMGLAHELGHMAQGVAMCESEFTIRETSAQIGAIEIVAGLALEGSPYYLFAVVEELRAMVISAAFGAAYQENRIEEFGQLRKRLSPGAISEARFQKMWRYLQEWFPMKSVAAYWLDPVKSIVKTVKQEEPIIEGLAFPDDNFINRGEMFVTNRDPKRRELDDTKYLLTHLEEIGADVKRK